jgi:hypothetical protein
MSDDTAAVLQTLRDYYAASNKHDVSSMVDYCEGPVMVITARGVMCWATHTEAIPKSGKREHRGGRDGSSHLSRALVRRSRRTP